MKLSDFVIKEAVIADLDAKDRDGAIKEMVDKLTEAGAIAESDAAELVKSIIKRERQGSTGFGKGVAVPHVKHSAVKTMVATIARSSSGIDFAALDRAPVYTIVLLLSPPDRPDEYLQAMENIFRHLQHDNFRRFLRQAGTVEEIVDLVEEADEMTTS